MAEYLDVRDAIFKTWQTIDGSTDSQRADAQVVLLPDFEMKHGLCIHKETGEEIGSAKVRAYYQERKPHLFPPKFERSLADRAFIDGNISARGTLLREVGEVEATRIAKQYGLASLHDTKPGTRPAAVADGSEKKSGTASHKDNPWGRNFNLTRQGQLMKALGREKCAAMAASVGSKIGATKPNVAYLESIGA